MLNEIFHYEAFYKKKNNIIEKIGKAENHVKQFSHRC